MKNIIYSFSINEVREVEETEISKDESGNEIKTTKKVKKEVPVEFGIKRPTRSLRDEAELFYGARYAEAVKSGLMPEAVLNKRVKDGGGVFDDEDKTKYAALYVDLTNLEREYQNILLVPETDRTEEQKNNLLETSQKMQSLRGELKNYTQTQTSLFNNTADSFARNKTIIWWFLTLSTKINNDKVEPLFVGKNYTERLANYDNVVENFETPNTLVLEACEKLLTFVTVWYFGAVSDQESFDKFMKETV